MGLPLILAVAVAAERWANDAARRVPEMPLLAVLAAFLAALLVRRWLRRGAGEGGAYAAKRGKDA